MKLFSRLFKRKVSSWQILLLTLVGLPFFWIVVGGAIRRGLDWRYDHLPSNRTSYAMTTIQYATLVYTIDHHRFPPSAENHQLVAFLTSHSDPWEAAKADLTEYLNSKGEIVDGWGTPLRIVFHGEDDVSIQSAGPDKIFGTPDDITNQ